MKAFKLIFTIGLIVVIAACSKQEITEPDNTLMPDLKTAGCTPSIWNYYMESDTLPFPPVMPTTCFLPDMVMLTSSNMITSGRVVTSASCRFNDKGEINWQMTGIGMMGDIYVANITNSYHFIGSITGQGAQVTRVIDEAVFTNTTTQATYTTTIILKQTINGNGQVVIDEMTFVPCE